MAIWGKKDEKKPGESDVTEVASTATTTTTTPASDTSSARTQASSGASTLEATLERFGKARSALGPGTVIQGKLTFDTPVRIDGTLTGEVFSSKALYVGPSGKIDARIEAASLVILGKVKGNIKATEKIEILGNGVLEGQVSTPSLIIEAGCIFNGECSMSSAVSISSDKSKKKEQQVTEIVEVGAPKEQQPSKSSENKEKEEDRAGLH